MSATCQHYHWPRPATPGHLCGKPAAWLGTNASSQGPTYRCEEHKYDLAPETMMKLRGPSEEES